MHKQMEQYFAKHVMFNGLVHLLIGIGIGILITYPLVGPHPLRYGLGFLAIGILGHLYPLIAKK